MKKLPLLIFCLILTSACQSAQLLEVESDQATQHRDEMVMIHHGERKSMSLELKDLELQQSDGRYVSFIVENLGNTPATIRLRENNLDLPIEIPKFSPVFLKRMDESISVPVNETRTVQLELKRDRIKMDFMVLSSPNIGSIDVKYMIFQSDQHN